MVIVLDSNIFISDFHLRGTAFETLRHVPARVDARVVVPQAVVEEVVRHFRIELEKSQRDAADALGRLARVCGNLDRIPHLREIPVDELSERYREELVRNLAQLNASVRPYPPITHQDIVRRLVERRKPFKENGAGYIDALVWETLIEVARETNALTFLISDNVKDFGNQAGNGLADDLVQEIRSAGLAHDAVQYYRSLRGFIEAEISPLLVPAEEIVEQFNRGEHYFLALIQEAFPEQASGLEENLVTRAINYFQRITDNEITVQNIGDELAHIHATSARWLSDTLIRLDFEAQFHVDFDFFIDKSDYWGIDLDRWHVGINDPDWNEWVMWVSSEQRISASFTVVIDVRQRRVVAFDAGEIEIVRQAEME